MIETNLDGEGNEEKPLGVGENWDVENEEMIEASSIYICVCVCILLCLSLYMIRKYIGGICIFLAMNLNRSMEQKEEGLEFREHFRKRIEMRGEEKRRKRFGENGIKYPRGKRRNPFFKSNQ